MRIYLRFATAAFYLFIALWSFFGASSTQGAELAGTLSYFGAAQAVVMWWVVDSMARKIPVPFMSLSPAIRVWPVLLAHQYFSTRGKRGWRWFTFHAALTLLVGLVARVLGDLVWGSILPS